MISAHPVRLIRSNEHERAGTTVFTPGTRGSPPALTGCEREQTVLRQSWANLPDGEVPPHDVATLEPRGNGSTVLLNWFKVARRKTGRIAHRTAIAKPVQAEQPFVDLLLQASVIRKILPRNSGSPASANPSGLRQLRRLRDLTVGLAPGAAEGPSCRPHRRKAHTLDRGVGRMLLNVSQEVRAKAPFLLVMAGSAGRTLPASRRWPVRHRPAGRAASGGRRRRASPASRCRILGIVLAVDDALRGYVRPTSASASHNSTEQPTQPRSALYADFLSFDPIQVKS